jgi:hypothetical protein
MRFQKKTRKACETSSSQLGSDGRGSHRKKPSGSHARLAAHMPKKITDPTIIPPLPVQKSCGLLEEKEEFSYGLC